MAFFRLEARVLGRSSKASAVKAAAYGSGSKLPAPTNAVRMAAYRSGSELRDQEAGKSFDFRRKHEEIWHSEIMAPANAPGWASDRLQLWNAVERAEKRKDAQLFREVLITLPRELDRAQCVDLVRGFVAEQFVGKGMVADVNLHRPDAADKEPQPHAHIMLTLRHLGPDGFGKKAREWNDIGQGRKQAGEQSPLMVWRERWEAHCNTALARAGSSAQVDHRSLATQRADALARAQGAREAGQGREAERQQARADMLNRAPQRPRGVTPALAAGRDMERMLRWHWAGLRRKARGMAQAISHQVRGVEAALMAERTMTLAPVLTQGRQLTREGPDYGR